MKKQFATSLSLLCITLVHPAYAEWFEVTGIADVKNGDHQKAKRKAVNDAITQALLFSGASVSSVQTVTMVYSPKINLRSAQMLKSKVPT